MHKIEAGGFHEGIRAAGRHRDPRLRRGRGRSRPGAGSRRRPFACASGLGGSDPDPDSSDLSITGSVRYRELTFEQVGTPKVEFSGGVVAPELGGDAKLHTVWHADRGTLPRPVQPGVVYRDNTVRLTITARFEDLARLFAEDAAPATRPAPIPSPSPGADRR